jgi:hypothetical protein
LHKPFRRQKSRVGVLARRPQDAKGLRVYTLAGSSAECSEALATFAVERAEPKYEKVFRSPLAVNQQQWKEQVMRKFGEAIAGSGACRLLPVLAVFAAVALSPGMRANTKPKPTEVPARVIAHLPLATPPGNEMVLQRSENKQYLYIQTASKQAYTIVEVTKPEFPSFVNPSAHSKDAPAGRLDIVGQDLGIAQVPDPNAKAIRSTNSPTETVKILDLTDPAHPKVLQTFTGVTSILPDGVRGLIYLTNNEGLWILKHNRQPFAPATKKRPCTSEDSLAAMPPDCE